MFEALGIDLVSLLWQIVAFSLLVWIINRLLFKPIRRTLDERNQRIQESMTEAERVKQQAMRAEEEFKARMEQARQESARMQDEGRERGHHERDQIIEQARAEAQQFLQEARVQVDLERRDAAREARRQVAGLAILAAGRVIGEALDMDKHHDLAERHIADLEQPLQELSAALSALPADKVGAAQVLSAVPLPEETEEAIRAQLNRTLGRETDVVFCTDARLLGGFVLQVSDQVIDLSVTRKLNDLFRELAT